MTNRIPLATGVLIWLTALYGCGLAHTAAKGASVHEVRIGEDVAPRLLYVQRGDEIRWHNGRPHPVQLGLLDTTWRTHVICEKGFRRFGLLEDLVVIPPQQYVSLCFSRVGTIRYNVWLDPDNLAGSMTPTSAIRVD
jgi:hypothetical protein